MSEPASTAIVTRPPAEVEVSSAQVRLDLAAARERARRRLEALEQRLHHAVDWRGFVRRHPVLTMGAAVVAGYALARLFSRR